MHGVTKHITQKGSIEVKAGKIIAKAKFNVKPEDYGIEIPSLVREKISSNMQINVDITYDAYK
jgi:polyisoprenoid-binding protein YceI